MTASPYRTPGYVSWRISMLASNATRRLARVTNAEPPAGQSPEWRQQLIDEMNSLSAQIHRIHDESYMVQTYADPSNASAYAAVLELYSRASDASARIDVLMSMLEPPAVDGEGT